MSSNINDLKKKYNDLLEREKRAEECLNKATDEQYYKWVSEFNKIVRALSKLMYQIPGMTKDEVLNGFNL